MTNVDVSNTMTITRELAAAARNAARATAEHTGPRIAELNTLNAAKFTRIVRAALAGVPAAYVEIALEEVVSQSQATDTTAAPTGFASQS